MLKKRIMTAAIALPIVVATFLYIPKALIFFVFLLMVLGTTYETANMFIPALRSRLGVPLPQSRPWVILSTIIAGLVYTFFCWHGHGAELGLGVVAIMMMFLIANFTNSSIDASIANMTGTLFSVIYGSLAWISLLDLYGMGEHSRYLFLLLGIVMANDSGAFFAGKYLGKTPLSPIKSPKKTWEGAVGGILGGIFGAFVINFFFWGELGSWTFMTFIGIVTGIAAILGDLTESTLKRFCGVKDSGTLFPGHGGLLDRTDSIIFAAPVLWFLLYLTKTYSHT